MSNILFILTGSIACYKACDAISQLVQRGHRVRVVATEAALRFVGRSTLEGLTSEPVATDLFAEGGALDHIELTRRADVTIVCPATANTINRIAAGVGDDLAGALLLAHDWKKPLLIAPAMNPAMWSHPATVAAVGKLREWGARFVAVGAGHTACGEIGEGRLAEPDEIVSAVESALAQPARRLRVLVTSGGTMEPIDAVRVIANTSTGATGALIAEFFARGGHDVVLLRARNAVPASSAIHEETFVTFADLDRRLGELLSADAFDVIIHAAAVSDFSVHAIEVDGVVQPPGTAKLRSEVAPVLRLRRNPKLLDKLRSSSRNPGVHVVAFKLTREATQDETRRAVESLFAGGSADFVVHNDLSARNGSDKFPADIWSRVSKEIVAHCAGRDEIGPALEKLFTGGANAMSEAEPPSARSGTGSGSATTENADR
jgi:phosphopantothenoylcysteine decarboxylase / phosphopantothenate---cysteine ligase